MPTRIVQRTNGRHPLDRGRIITWNGSRPVDQAKRAEGFDDMMKDREKRRRNGYFMRDEHGRLQRKAKSDVYTNY